MKITPVKIASSFLILMFIVSGISKVFSLGKSESERLSKKTIKYKFNNESTISFFSRVMGIICFIYITTRYLELK